MKNVKTIIVNTIRKINLNRPSDCMKTALESQIICSQAELSGGIGGIVFLGKSD